MNNYIKWSLEICNQEYKGDLKLFNSNIKNMEVIEWMKN